MDRDQLPIVVAVPDGDDDALLRYAAREALVRGCPVRLLHVLRGADTEHADGVVASAVARTEVLAGPGVMVTGEVVTGAPVAAVLDAGGEAQAVVVRHRDVLHLHRALSDEGRPGGDPVVICVPATWSAVPDDDRPVLVGVDDPATAHTLVTAALELASVHDTSLGIRHTWRFPRRYDTVIDARIGEQWCEQVRSSLGATVAACRSGPLAHVPVEVVVEHGAPAELLVAAGRAAQALVLQRNLATAGPEHVGRTTRTALHECPCPVVLLPPGPAAP